MLRLSPDISLLSVQRAQEMKVVNLQHGCCYSMCLSVNACPDPSLIGQCKKTVKQQNTSVSSRSPSHTAPLRHCNILTTFTIAFHLHSRQTLSKDQLCRPFLRQEETVSKTTAWTDAKTFLCSMLYHEES